MKTLRIEDPVDDAARTRLRHAIVADDGDEEQLDGVIRMLGAEIPPEEDQLPLFGTEADRHPSGLDVSTETEARRSLKQGGFRESAS